MTHADLADDLRGLLTTWPAPTAGQEALRVEYLAHLEAHDAATARSGPPAHFTASCLVVDPGAEHVLLTLHPKVGRWLQFGGHLEEEGLGEPHVLPVAAGVVVRVPDALRTGGAQQGGARAHARADPQRPRRLWTVVHDLRAELVAHDDVAREVHDAGVAGAAPGLDEPLGVAEGVKIRAADAAGEGADEHLARPGHGVGDLALDQPADLFEHDRAHRFTLSPR